MLRAGNFFGEDVSRSTIAPQLSHRGPPTRSASLPFDDVSRRRPPRTCSSSTATWPTSCSGTSSALLPRRSAVTLQRQDDRPWPLTSESSMSPPLRFWPAAAGTRATVARSSGACPLLAVCQPPPSRGYWPRPRSATRADDAAPPGKPRRRGRRPQRHRRARQQSTASAFRRGVRGVVAALPDGRPHQLRAIHWDVLFVGFGSDSARPDRPRSRSPSSASAPACRLAPRDSSRAVFSAAAASLLPRPRLARPGSRKSAATPAALAGFGRAVGLGLRLASGAPSRSGYAACSSGPGAPCPAMLGIIGFGVQPPAAQAGVIDSLRLRLTLERLTAR